MNICRVSAIMLCNSLFVLLLSGCNREPKKNTSDQRKECFASITANICTNESGTHFCFYLAEDSTLSFIVTSFTSGDAAVRCTLNVTSEIYVLPPERLYAFNDLDGDGCKELIVYSNLGVNGKAQYWLGKGQGQFLYLGQFQELQKENEFFRSYVRGGYAGLEYESNEYYFEGDSLVICRTLTQKFDRGEADTSYFILTETARPPCGEISRTAHVKVYPFSADSTVIDTVR